MATKKGKTPATPNTPATPVTCTVCGKTLTKAQTQANGVGHKCAQVQAQFTPAQLQAHYAKLTGTPPAGYITVASLHKTIVANKHKYPGLTVSAMVRAIGGDRAIKPAAHPIAKPVYNHKGWRYVNPWLATPAGLQAIASGNFSKAPKV